MKQYIIIICILIRTITANCPSSCRCNATNAICKSLSRIPDLPQSVLQLENCLPIRNVTNLPQSLKRFNAAHNFIESLCVNQSKLEMIDLSFNHFEYLPFLGFLPSLKKFEINNNQIKEVMKDAFLETPNLRTLRMSDNFITSLNPWIFKLKSLKALYLSNNRLSYLSDRQFVKHRKLAILDLSGNKMIKISWTSFYKLNNINLMLQDCGLETVPTKSFRRLQMSKLLSLDDNLFTNLSEKSFSSFKVLRISVSYCKNLQFIDDLAFYKLDSLQTLDLHNNLNLQYISPKAFHLLNNLQELNLQENSLLFVPSRIGELPNLLHLKVEHNKLLCDCNNRWLRLALRDNKTYLRGTRPKCWKTRNNFSFTEMNVEIFTKCKPTIIRFFSNILQVEEGTKLILNCRAIGDPLPTIVWRLANGQVINGTSNYSRFYISGKGTLIIHHVRPSDAGRIMCSAESILGTDTKSTQLKVHSPEATILLPAISTDFLKIQWNGTARTIYSSDYRIQYRPISSEYNYPYKTVKIDPYMNSYTLHNLQPQTPYEICLVLQTETSTKKLNCKITLTKPQEYQSRGIHTVDTVSILAAMIGSVLGLVIVITFFMCLKRWHRRKLYSTTMEGSITSSIIPLERFNSKSSLITATSVVSSIQAT